MRESMEFDIVIVGGGPSGLAAGIKLAKLSQEFNLPLSICILDKGAHIGAHILSGAVLEPRSLTELISNWADLNFPIKTKVSQDKFIFLTQNRYFSLPIPAPLANHGNYIISLGLLCQRLAQEAEGLGVNIFPGFAAVEVIYDQDRVVGVITGDQGVDRHGQPKSNYQSGITLYAKQIIFAEGCRGSLTKSLLTKFNLQANAHPQTFGLGIKEIWELDPAIYTDGMVIHTIGWPLDYSTYGGSFAYHFDGNKLSLGLVVGLDYKNPYINPYEEFQRLKSHKYFRAILKGGRRIAYGARTLVEGGIQCLPKLTMPGAVLIGDAAGFLNVAKIKGINNAIKSGMIAAENIFQQFKQQQPQLECQDYPTTLKTSWLWDDLYRVRNIRPSFQWGLMGGLAYSALDTYIFRGRAPWTLQHTGTDHGSLDLAHNSEKIVYPPHDHEISFDLTESLFLANVAYDENQPYHLKLTDRYELPIAINYKLYASPETRYCPAGVYEILTDASGKKKLQINGGNCIHCKACDIKDPRQNINWTPSEGGSGPNYGMM